MIRKTFFLFPILAVLAAIAIVVAGQTKKTPAGGFISYIADTRKQEVKFYRQNDKQENFGSIHHLKTWLERNHKQLVFATNGGMYRQDHSPQGLFIENNNTVMPLDTSNGNGNLYLKPNGVFYITVTGFSGCLRHDKFYRQRKNKIRNPIGTDAGC